MDQSAAPMLDALTAITPPTGTASRRRGILKAAARTRAAIGADAFRSDVVATAGWVTAASHEYRSRC